jgi:hypothetical protein
MFACAICDVREIEEFLAQCFKHEPLFTADDERFLAELGVGW